MKDETLIDDGRFVTKADELLAAITSIRLTGDVEVVTEAEQASTDKSGGGFSANLSKSPGVEASLSAETIRDGRGLLRETRRGAERISLNFSDVARALRELADTLSSRRIWLILDEWSSTPRDLQPYLAEFLVRCVLPLQRFTVKIAAIEQQTMFRTAVDGRIIGIELGADMGAHVNLDDFLVYEGNEEQARAFFRSLFYKHLKSIVDSGDSPPVDGLKDPGDVVRLGFTDSRAFDELVRAAEGVPRDALYIAARAGARAGQERISVPLVRAAARTWYQTDKSRPLESREEAQRLLNWIIDKVIREKRARAFLVNEINTRNSLLLALFDARVLHIVRRGYSAQDQPGERFDVWCIDYGAYVDLLQTKYAPRGALPFGDDAESEEYVDLDVPLQDLRAIRRAILDLNEYQSSGSTS